MVDWDKLVLIRGDLVPTFFLNSPCLGDRSLAAEASLELDFSFGPPGVERSLEAENSLEEERFCPTC